MAGARWIRLAGNQGWVETVHWVGEPVVVAESVAGTDRATVVGLPLPRATQRRKLRGRSWLVEVN